MTQSSRRMTYQPYIFAMALLGLLGKVSYSLAKNEKVSDSLFYVFLVVFLVSSLLYYLDRVKTGRVSSTTIRTGNVKESDVIGTIGTSAHDSRTTITTKDVDKSRIIGSTEKK